MGRLPKQEEWVTKHWITGEPRHAHILEEHLSYLWGFQYGQGVWHSCEGLIYLLDIDGVFLMCVRGWGTRLYEGLGESRTEEWRGRETDRGQKGWNS